MNNLSKELAKRAKQKGICKEWYQDLKQISDTEKFLDMYLKGIDFCLSNDYPSNDFIQENFKGKIEHRGVHLDEVLKITNDRFVVALGKCAGSIEVNEFAVSEVFLKHESQFFISAKGNAFVMVDIFDNSGVTIKAADNAKVCVNRYGGNVNVTTIGENCTVKVKEKNKKTY